MSTHEEIIHLKSLAETGDTTAQCRLGWMYQNGKGVPMNYIEAVNWYRKAAIQGYTDAQNNLGVMYQNGKGVPQNYAEAVTWFVVAAGQGNSHAQNNLGSMYQHGKGVPQSDAEAEKWYRKAAEQGNTDAQKKLDQMKAEGIKVDKPESKPFVTKEPPAQNFPNQGPSKAQWWYAYRGSNNGPIEAEELMKLLQIGNINLKTLVWQEGMAAWQPLDEVEELGGLKTSIPPPLPKRNDPQPSNYPQTTHSQAFTKRASRQSLYEAFLGEKNRIYYLKEFESFDQQGPGLKPSRNWPALLAGGTWALYRKMYGWFFVFYGGVFFLAIIFSMAGSQELGSQELSAIVFLMLAIPFSIYANSLYHNSIKKKIAAAQLTMKEEPKLLEYLRYKGGVNTWVIWVCSGIPVFGILIAILIPLWSSMNVAKNEVNLNATSIQPTFATEQKAPEPMPAPAPEEKAPEPAPAPAPQAQLDHPYKDFEFNRNQLSAWQRGVYDLSKKEDRQGLLYWCQEWTRSEPENGQAWAYLSSAYSSLHRFEEATEAYKKSIEVGRRKYGVK